MKAFFQILTNFGKPYMLYFILGPLAKTIEVIFDLLTPLVIGWMVDAGVLNSNTEVCFQAGILLFCMAVFGFLITLICQKMASLTSQGIGTDTRKALLDCANESDYLAFSALGSSTFLTRSTNDVNQVQVGIAMLIRQVIRWPVLAVGSIICALSINMELGLVLCGALPLIIIVFWLVMHKTSLLFLNMQKLLDNMNTFVKETIVGIRPIRSFCKTTWANNRFYNENKTQSNTGRSAATLSALLSPATFCIFNGAAVLVLFLSKPLLLTDTLQAGQVMALLGYMNQLLLAIVYVANLTVIFSKASVSAKRILQALSIKKRPVQPGATPNKSKPLLELNELSFTYKEGEKDVLSQLSFVVKKGMRLGIVGGTGSGKTTLARMLVRLTSPTGGHLFLWGNEEKNYSDESLAKMVSYVPQHATLFSGTIRENLVWRNPSATPSELNHALELAKVDFLSGLDDKVEPEGKNFSGGQRQRLTIARSLVGSADLLILDDATSALDFTTEAHIINNLKQSKKFSAIIQITQRIHTVQDADSILVLDKGKALGLGTHKELLKSCTLYQELYQSQIAAEEAEYV